MKDEQNPSIRMIMDALVDCRLKSTKPEYFSDLFVRMAWSQDHDKMHVVGVFEDWLSECTDSYRVEVVLRNNEFFPFIEENKFYEALDVVRIVMPNLSALCDDIAEARKSH